MKISPGSNSTGVNGAPTELKSVLEACGIPEPLDDHNHWLTTQLHVPHFPIEGDKWNL